MRQLSAHDAGFLYSDTSHSNANVTLIQIYDQSTAPGGKVRFKSILAHIESRLAGLPIFRSKLQRVPLDLDHPYWVDDPNFDLEYHVRHIALPKPGDWRQFCIQASRIHARPLDLNRPLWEIYVVEGLDSLLELPAGSFALLTKIHHAAVDAEGGSRIAMLLHDITPHVAPLPPPRPWFPQPAPGAVNLLLRSWLNSLLSPLELRTPLARRMADTANAAYTFVGDLLLRPEQLVQTRFNSVVSAHRMFDTRRFMVEEFEAIRHLAEGATVGDAVLAVCGGGLRRYLQAVGELPPSSLSAITPVSARQPGALADRTPQMSWLRVQLGTDVEDPVQRLAAIRAQTAATAAATAAADDAAGGVGHHAATLALSGKMHGLLGLSSARRTPNAACTITNVAGPDVPLYLHGARMTYFSAIMPIHDGMGLVFAVTRYDSRIIISPTSCRELLPDPEAFTQQIRDSFQEYLALARAAAAKPRRSPRSARPRASAPGSASPKPPKARKASTGLRVVPGGPRRSEAQAG